MATEVQRRLGKIQFIAGSIGGMLKLAEDEDMEMLVYLLEMALVEAVDIEAKLKAGAQ